ncbi:hypothetical protein ANCCAN_12382 [Ancylostoma caninum]|uniref:Uncharacterized protein n=1 Tax=Ancylostoma caninum TaxID=29170 RepID=A0A368GBD4_ANCCA|nr:hypothetical protein ANCCAN_12382 [Ancylostoma caninum]
MAVFSGRSAFNPFTHAVAATFNEDLVDSWGTGFAVNGVNNYNLQVRRNFDQYADAPLDRNDGMYQPFLTAAAVGGEYDLSKIREVSGHMDLPIPGVNELFDLDGRIMLKGGGNGILNSALEFPLTLSDPNERAPYTFKYLNFMADRHMQYGHVVPNVNLFLVGKDKIMDRLSQNTLNPTMIAPFIRDRPRGLGLLQLPTGMTDERSGPFFPNLYIAGDKAGEKPMSVPDVHLPGQKADFSGRSAFNPFTHAVAAVFNEDLVDSWGAGFAVNGVNNHDLQVRRNFDQFADIAFERNDGMHQPFLTAFSVGSEYDYSKIKEISGHLDLPIPGVNELFDFDGRLMVKGNGNGILNSAMEFPLTLSDPNERAPYTFKYLNFMADRHMQYGHVVPNVNLFLVGKDKIMDRLVQNRLNPTMIG